MLASFIIPFFIAAVVVYGMVKKVNVFDCFAEGARQGADIVISLLPVLTGLVVAVAMFNASGGAELLEKLLRPAASLFGIPSEVVSLCILSPVSGSGSLTIFESILKECGPDSFPGRVASVIAGATETTFYAVTVYFGSVDIKKTGAVLPCALIGDFVSFAAAAFTVKWFFY